ncbi:MAG TPA: preprotein translocase subunit YajC [Marinilabiliales bacterium]|jgi:preprotein translocase subunit YajC|nr:MAG: preprotein translocase subunit YajC [Bacteroidetes bacterium GWA2_40_14]OFX60489.1 MAG: preprotein translocase subunit YajC [Bacteroidetes bacterium GWC2_40_13]OFX75454.1 MAG: preprotein translocase subunit YajC [Bacteroidetes bacterium GWD2_40_43]OFX93969.1 MAG: preprotein translocase subunit YajC [Bacteroidetes bacterium GWE2_40_63]OFY19758.1 MAG: preprotein translocase subunit YajC [Bacteroidetes bacterium GWF2_40_13]OFZ24522.1 MAG: preprotein translocase subunit YajC [Bacteroidetes
MNYLTSFLMAPANGQQGNPMSTLIFMVLIIVIFYFFMIRPQMKKQKEVRQFRDGIKKGDKVLTVGGIYGRVSEVNDNTVLLEIADGIRIKVDKAGLVKDPTDISAEQAK